jgi:hypothetical protein
VILGAFLHGIILAYLIWGPVSGLRFGWTIDRSASR